MDWRLSIYFWIIFDPLSWFPENLLWRLCSPFFWGVWGFLAGSPNRKIIEHHECEACSPQCLCSLGGFGGGGWKGGLWTNPVFLKWWSAGGLPSMSMYVHIYCWECYDLSIYLSIYLSLYRCLPPSLRFCCVSISMPVGALALIEPGCVRPPEQSPLQSHDRLIRFATLTRAHHQCQAGPHWTHRMLGLHLSRVSVPCPTLSPSLLPIIYLSINLCVSLSVYVCLCLSLSVSVSVCLCLCLSLSVSVCLSVCLPVCLPSCLAVSSVSSACLSVHLSAFVYVLTSINVLIDLSMFWTICLSINPTIPDHSSIPLFSQNEYLKSDRYKFLSFVSSPKSCQIRTPPIAPKLIFWSGSSNLADIDFPGQSLQISILNQPCNLGIRDWHNLANGHMLSSSSFITLIQPLVSFSLSPSLTLALHCEAPPYKPGSALKIKLLRYGSTNSQFLERAPMGSKIAYKQKLFVAEDGHDWGPLPRSPNPQKGSCGSLTSATPKQSEFIPHRLCSDCLYSH